MKAIMTQSVKLLGTSLALNKGQTVTITPATNLPQGGYFAAPVDGSWGEYSILLRSGDFRPVLPLSDLCRAAVRNGKRPARHYFHLLEAGTFRRAGMAWKRVWEDQGDCKGDIPFLAALAVAEAFIGRKAGWIPAVQSLAAKMAEMPEFQTLTTSNP